MRNNFPGICYRCGQHCAKGDGHFEKNRRDGWRIQHADCAIKHRGTKLDVTEADRRAVSAQRAFRPVIFNMKALFR